MSYHVDNWTISVYRAASGVAPVLEFLRGLTGDAKQEVLALLSMLMTHGHQLREPFSKALGEGLFELRGRTSGVRVFYTFRPGRVVVLLDGLIKKRDDIPARTIERLRRLQRMTRS